MLPSFTIYGKYSSDNYGVNTLKFYTGDLTIWFSYRTPVAFQKRFNDVVIRENDWGATTGKHLNWIDPDHSKRISGEEFQARLKQAIGVTYE
jgi:hypothetical protein